MGLICALAALVVFALATFGVTLGSLNMVALGLALLTLGFILGISVVRIPVVDRRN